MAQVSRNPLPDRTWKTIWQTLVELIGQSKKPKEAALIVSGLTSPTEQIMIAKRLMVGILTVQGYNTREIAQLLHISTSTASTHQRIFKHNVQFRHMLKRLFPQPITQNKTATQKEFIEGILHIFSPRKKQTAST